MTTPQTPLPGPAQTPDGDDHRTDVRDLRAAVAGLTVMVGILVVGAAIGLSFVYPRLAIPLQTGAAVAGAFILVAAVVYRRQ
ncbi:hypothetical protein ACWF94_02220 [Streptomyces sp. NPDC055078]